MSVPCVVTTNGKYKAAVDLKPRQIERPKPWYVCVCVRDYQKTGGGDVC